MAPRRIGLPRWPGLLGAAIAASMLALSGCAPPLTTGARCTRSSECEAPLACLLGRCRNECLSDRDCLAGATCQPVGDGLGACTVDDENACTAALCPAPLECRASRCRASCLGDGDCLASQVCREAVCVMSEADAGVPDAGISDTGISDTGIPDTGSSDTGIPDTGAPDAGARFPAPRLCNVSGECAVGEVCGADEPPSVCHAGCTGHADCALPSVCDDYDTDDGPVFGCSIACRPGTTEGCAPGTWCRMGFRATDVFPTGPAALTFCSAPPLAGGTDGCRCEDTDSSSECAGGLSCEQPFGPTDRMCLEICVVGEECRPDVDCVATPRSVIVEGRQYGVCPPAVTTPLTCP